MSNSWYSWYLKPIDPIKHVGRSICDCFNLFVAPKFGSSQNVEMLETRRIWCIPKYLLLVPWPHAYCKNPHFQLVFQFLEREIYLVVDTFTNFIALCPMVVGWIATFAGKRLILLFQHVTMFVGSWLQFPLQNQGCWGPKNLRFWRANLKPNRATESRTMGWQPPKNHQFWSFLDPILVGPWFCRLVKLGAPTPSWECTKPYILGKELILEKIRLVMS